METLENEPHVSHCSHRAWKTRQTAPTFPQLPQPLLLEMFEGKENKSLSTGYSKSSRQHASESVKTTSPGHTPLAGFEVSIYGRFSSDHRGWLGSKGSSWSEIIE